MTERQPIAFLSYVRSDDDHDEGRISAFRRRLEGEVKMQTGEPFAIFQDRNDISWGQQWEDRINKSLSDVTFLIPIITPSFFKSPACRSEFTSFSLKEELLGINRLILPLYYVACDQFDGAYQTGFDEIVDVLKLRNWTDWRKFRFKSFSDEVVAAALAEMATTIKLSMTELRSINTIVASQASTAAMRIRPIADLPEIVAEGGLLGTIRSEYGPSLATDLNIDSVPEFQLSKPDESQSQPIAYYAYTKRFDEVLEASELGEKSELFKLHKYLGSFSKAFKKIHDRSLMAFLSRFRAKTNPLSLAVSILIDNSGSMRGERIIHTAAWCLLIAEWMDRLNVPTEFLGYTTRAWKGGQSRELWLASGKPSNPGRLNDLRHLIYKPFSASIGASAPNFGAMAREGLLKENIDGEAILWAAARLTQEPAANRMLFVISDGAPVDDSTLSVNAGDYLEQHLKSVIDDVSSMVKLYAIGVGYDVSRYYPNAVMLKDASELGPRFFEALVNEPAFEASFSSSRPKKRYRYGSKEDEE